MTKLSQKTLLIEQLKKIPVVQIACEKVGISRALYYVWRKKDKKFATDADQAILDGSLIINDLAETQLITAIREQNFQAIHLWLRSHHPKYSNKLEITGNINQTRGRDLTPMQRKNIAKALRLAALGKKYENKQKNQ